MRSSDSSRGGGTSPLESPLLWQSTPDSVPGWPRSRLKRKSPSKRPCQPPWQSPWPRLSFTTYSNKVDDDPQLRPTPASPGSWQFCFAFTTYSAHAGADSGWSRCAHILKTSSPVLCVVGAGLSAPSGTATWRGTNGLSMGEHQGQGAGIAQEIPRRPRCRVEL